MAEPRRALITGVTGQDGSYLTELLLERGYEVHGIIRRSSSFNTGRVMHMYQDPHVQAQRFFLYFGDLNDASSVSRLVEKIHPDEVYNLAGQSHVRVSFDIPEYTAEINAIGALRILDAIKEGGLRTRFYQASSSEMYGAVTEVPQSEATPFSPRSPYATAKLFAYWMTRNYREAYGIFACNGILFNHESPRRGETFVTRKITRGLARILAGKDQRLYMGNLDAKRDWGYARDYVQAMWLMMQQAQPDDYVVATGESHSVREFLAEAFALVGRDWRDYVEIDPRYYRPLEVETLQGDATKAREKLGWRPTVTFKQLVRMMVVEDLKGQGLDPDGLIVLAE